MAAWLAERWRGVHDAITPKQASVAVILAGVLTGTIRAWDQISTYLSGQGVTTAATVPSILIGLLALLTAVAWFLMEHIVRLNRLLAPKFKLSFDRDSGTGVVAAIERITTTGGLTSIALAEFRAAYVRIKAETSSRVAVRGCSAFLTGIETGSTPGATSAFCLRLSCW